MAMRNTIAVLVMAAALWILGGCRSPNFELLHYDGGRVMGNLYRRSPDRFYQVTVESLQSPMARRTTIELSVDERIRVSDVTPEVLLKRRTENVALPDRLEDDGRKYSIALQASGSGPTYHFEIQSGRIAEMWASWQELPPGSQGGPIAPVFIGDSGKRYSLPLSRKDVEAIWGPPERISEAYGPW